MHPERVIARQCPKTEDLSGLPGGSIPYYTAAFSAALCHGLARRCYLSARLRFLQDWSVLPELFYLLNREAHTLARLERWRGRRVPIFKRMAWLAMMELAEPRLFSQAKVRLAFMGLSRRQWYGTWRPRYQALYETAHTWSDVALSHVAHQNKVH